MVEIDKQVVEMDGKMYSERQMIDITCEQLRNNENVTDMMDMMIVMIDIYKDKINEELL